MKKTLAWVLYIVGFRTGVAPNTCVARWDWQDRWLEGMK